MRRFLSSGGPASWLLIAAATLALGANVLLVRAVLEARYRRDLARMVFNDNLELLQDVRRRLGEAVDSLASALRPPQGSEEPEGVLVVSIADRRLWYRVGRTLVYETRVATGSGRILVPAPGGPRWKFETPRGRLVVLSKEPDPYWVPPDWHYVELAQEKRLRLVQLFRGQILSLRDGSLLEVSGSDVIRRFPDGRWMTMPAGTDIIVDGTVVIPPFGTNQRRYPGVLGPYRLNLGDGYAIHGTNVPSSVGRPVTHGCIRVRNEDIETLYRIVPVGTPVYIY
jgi:hypothetical protein